MVETLPEVRRPISQAARRIDRDELMFRLGATSGRTARELEIDRLTFLALEYDHLADSSSHDPNLTSAVEAAVSRTTQLISAVYALPDTVSARRITIIEQQVLGTRRS